ncbi:hypothetical protein [Paenibacillus camelliae]|uniref:hypothetical protein n=1 Tax=Paenibacillus camelliae TaxID=512410 RepID=UPI00203D0D50|nr:hypothetical protein [Paenibacillus camelliae]MCM3632625.1 hypothetical protein [Paenibacillus camelliae]
MKVILDIEDNLLSEMQMHADIVQEDLNVMLSNMFIKQVLIPSQLLRQEQQKDECSEFESFHALFYEFLSELAHDPNNLEFYKVLIRLRDEHLQSTYVSTDLFKTYRQLNYNI